MPVSLQARRSRRSSRSRRPVTSPAPSHSTAVLHEPLVSPYQGRLRIRAQPTPAAHNPDVAGSSSQSAQARTPAQGAAERSTAEDDRQSRARQNKGLSHNQQSDAAAAGASGAATSSQQHSRRDNSDDDGANHRQHQQLSHGRALRSRRGKVPEPDDAQLQSDDDAQLAQALHESLLSQPMPSRRSGRSTRATAIDNQPTPDAAAAEEAAGPSHASEQTSPGSSRETRAQQRALRHQQMYMHEALPEAVNEPALEPGGHFVRRSQRQQTQASSASVEASQRAIGAVQMAEGYLRKAAQSQDRAHDVEEHMTTRRGGSGIKLTLRPNSTVRQSHEPTVDANPVAPTSSGRTSLRISLRPRRT